MNIPDVQAHEIPLEPPSHFEYKVEDSRPGENLLGIHEYEGWDTICHLIMNVGTSGTSGGTVREIRNAFLDTLATVTASRIAYVSGNKNYFEAEERTKDVNPTQPIENIYQIRLLTGFTWQKIAELLNVDRRTITNWNKGSQIRDTNKQHIANTLKTLQFIDRGSIEDNAFDLQNQKSGGHSALELISRGNHALARKILGCRKCEPLSQSA